MKQETRGGLGVLELLLSDGTSSEGSNSQPSNVAVGIFTGFDPEGRPCIALSDGETEQPVPARSVVSLGQSQLGCEVVLAFDRGDRERPIVLGVLQPPRDEKVPEEITPSLREVEAELDGERLELSAKREIVLRCGKASITLTRAGKVLIRGAYLLSRSSGANRIKGGSVQIN
jgi:Domain of unknown function (DUF6484)